VCHSEKVLWNISILKLTLGGTVLWLLIITQLHGDYALCQMIQYILLVLLSEKIH